jgi:hypothetical protein
MKHIRSCGLVTLAALLLLLSASLSHAGVIEREIKFPDPVVSEADGRSIISLEGLTVHANPGEPLLPFKVFTILLPPGEAVSGIEVAARGTREIELGAPPEWGQPQAPRSHGFARQHVMADPVIYRSSEPYPRRRALHLTTETFRGHNIAFIRVYPVLYMGAGNLLVHARELVVTITTSPSRTAAERSEGTLRPGVEADAAAVRRLTGELPAPAAGMPRPLLGEGTFLVRPEDSYPVVIITHADLMPAFENLKALRDSQGLLTRVLRIAQITPYYDGLDLQDRLRKFIRDAYLYWETEYVILGGDDEIIPHRGFYAEILPYVTDHDIASDLYYSALDGNWNDDGDGRWGEPGEADLLPEVSVGRVPVNTLAEANNFVSKLINYETAPVTGQIKVAQMAAELIYDEPTWGADDKEEIRLGSSAHGFTTAGIPPDFTVHTLYDRDLYPDEWDNSDILARLNSGRHLVNHSGHCINYWAMKLTQSDVASFTNDGVTSTYFVAYVHGCFSAAFDNRLPDHSYTDDAVSEYCLFDDNAAVAWIGNTRYGCGAHGSTRSAAQYCDRQFFDALFGEGITTIGNANDDSKVDNIPLIDFRGMRWTYYTLVLLGDPSMDIWTDSPGTLTVSHPDTIHISDNEIEVTVSGQSGDLAGARVSVFTDSLYSGHGFTDGAGVARFDPGVIQAGTVYLAVKAHNHYAYLDSVPVVQAGGALLTVSQVAIDDDGGGASSGNGDGKADAGEVIELQVSVENVGQTAAHAVAGTLRSADPLVTISDSTASFGDVQPGGTAERPFVCGIDPEAPDSHSVDLQLILGSDGPASVRHFSIMLAAPDLLVSGIARYDSLGGNGNGCLEPGETFELEISFANAGSGSAGVVTVELTEDDPYATIVSGSASIPGLAAGGEATAGPPFVISLLPECPPHHVVAIDFDISFASGRQASAGSAVHVGGALSDDFEAGAGGWTHSDITLGYVDQWHLETYRNHSAAGSTSWKFGGAGAGKYAYYAQGGLVTPELCLGPDAALTFWHWIQVELESGNYASDGGIVEISTDGGASWTRIDPVGGYTHLIQPGTSTPIPAGTPCFGWTDDWTHVEFDLSAFTGPARIRFHFGGGEHAESHEGWYVDDVVVTDAYASVSLDDGVDIEPSRLAIRSTHPNPFRSRVTVVFDVPERSKVSLQIFDVRGRRVDSLPGAIFERGRNSVDYDGSGLNPGIYFIALRSGDVRFARKVVIH